jgi:MFS family permease
MAALRHREYRRVWTGALVSATGDWLQITGRAYLVYAITGSPTALGAVYFFSYLPQVLFALPGGALADRVDRKRLVVAGNAAQGLVAVALAALVWAAQASVWNVAALSFVAGTAMTLTLSPTLALLPSLVPRAELHSAMSLNGTTYSVSRIFGPLLAGLIIPLWGVGWVFAVNAVTFAYAVAVWWLATVPPRAPASPVDQTGIRHGLRHAWTTPTIRVPVIIMAVLGLVGFVYQPLAVVYATDVLAGGDDLLGGRYFGLMQAMMGVGSVVGIVGLAELGRHRPALTVLGGTAGFAVALAALGLTAAALPALALSVAVAGLHMGVAVLIQTIVQHEVDESLRGRMMSIVMMAWVGSIPFASWLWGAVASRVPVGRTFVLAAVVLLGATVVALPWSRRIRLHQEPA